MEKKINVTLWILLGVLVLLIIGLLSSTGVLNKLKTSGRAISQKAETYADIQNWFSINISLNLSNQGIVFNITGLPTNLDGANATLNYDASSQTLYFVANDRNSNVPVQFCIRQNESLKSGINTIPSQNYDWSNSSTTDLNLPPIGSKRDLPVDPTWDYSNNNTAANSYVYYRFWLYVAGTQSPGIYRNRVEIKAVQAGNAC